MFQHRADTTSDLWNIPQHNDWFVGRKNELDEIKDRLEKITNRMVKVLITGLPGIGKSQIVKKFAHLNKANYQLIWWIDAETLLKLEQGLSTLAQKLNIVINGRNFYDVLSDLKEKLRLTPNWLIILDNMENLSSLNDFLPEQHTNTRGHVLITSRDCTTLTNPLKLGPLSPSASEGYLLQTTGQTNTEAAKNLAYRLGYFPLALCHAVAYMNEFKCTFEGYLDLYNVKNTELTKSNEENITAAVTDNYFHTVQTTFQMLFAKLRDQTPSLELLFFCSFISPDRIPKFLIERFISTKQYKLDATMAVLIKYSLVQRDRIYSANHTEGYVFQDSYSIHRLIQEFCFSQLGHNDTCLRVNSAIGCLNVVFPLKDQTTDDIFRRKQLMPHLEAIIKCASQQNVANVLLARFYINLGAVKLDFSKPSEAIRYYEHAISIMNFGYDLDDPEFGQVYNDLGNAYGDDGNERKAKECYEKSLKIRIKHHGTNHILVSDSHNNLGISLRRLGDISNALKHHQEALRIRELNKDEIKIALSLNNIGFIHLSDTKDFDTAQVFLTRALEKRRAIYYDQPNHPNIAQTLYNLGYMYYKKRNIDLALKTHLEALQIRLTTLGETHRLVADSLNDIALCYAEMNNLAMAEEYNQKALTIYTQTYKDNHPELAEYYSNLGNIYDKFNKKELALMNYDKALTIYLSNHDYGPNHNRTIEIQNKIAAIKSTLLTNAQDALNATAACAQP